MIRYISQAGEKKLHAPAAARCSEGHSNVDIWAVPALALLVAADEVLSLQRRVTARAFHVCAGNGILLLGRLRQTAVIANGV